ncbi:unnamed protein product [Symbiodinium microadriaticum]|nr:unnamed protein product [Symbiodinium microadriaticum]
MNKPEWHANGWRTMTANKITSWLFAAIASLFLTVQTAQADPVLPHYQDDTHTGVTSCAGSTCHGSLVPWEGSNILQNEYIIWRRDDAHARSYRLLLEPESRRIARNLGLKEPAHKAKICLDCHVHNPDEAHRGERFLLTDGIGCEGCHGAAEKWLGPHAAGTNTFEDRAKLIDMGLYPLDEPVARAELCLSCHFGDQTKFVTHRIMGAGHPRMSFELDTFAAIQPAHFVLDEDYGKRKIIASGIQFWATGQAMMVSKVADALSDPNRNRDGMWPELVLFDCHACHHVMKDTRWQPRNETGLPAGTVRINDAAMVMLAVVAAEVDPDLETQLRRQSRDLHQASRRGIDSTAAKAKALGKTADALAEKIAVYDFDRAAILRLANGLAGAGSQNAYFDYGAAEQATMALGSFVNALADGQKSAEIDRLNKALNGCYDAVQDEDNWLNTAYEMADDDTTSELEIRHLQDTIKALRDGMEDQSRIAGDGLQAERARLQLEIDGLQDTIRTLRDRMEANLSDARAEQQAERARYEGEIDQLRQTAQSLRETLDELALSHKAAMEEKDRLHQLEIRALQDTVQALRDTLDGKTEGTAAGGKNG